MKFGQVTNPQDVDFTIPKDDPATKEVLAKAKGQKFEVNVGCAKWNKTDLKGFYPRGIKDELEYYSRQFNSIELNATFYKTPSVEQVKNWSEKTPAGFKFFPKISNTISHFKRLLNVKDVTDEYCNAVANFEKKLGMVFLQLHDNFSPNEFEKLKIFAEQFPKGIPLAVEVRNKTWFDDGKIWDDYCKMLSKSKMANIIVDTAGRRDMMHMRLTTPVAFVRWVGCNDDDIDHKRLDEWVTRIKKWHREGLKELHFFVHQNIELSSPLLSAYFIEKLNKELKTDLKIPDRPDADQNKAK